MHVASSLTMTASEIISCSFSSWYSTFQHITINSCIIPLPQNFIDYLNSDGVVVPDWPLRATSSNQNRYVDADDEESDEVSWDDDADTVVAEPPSFPDFEAKINACMARLGGSVFPKLNWSAPQDASWIAANKTLKCTNPTDLYLLLKSSSFISHDLNMKFDGSADCEEYQEDSRVPVKFELVLRKWTELEPSMEFRCFVKNKKLIGISQRRNHCQFSNFIKKHEDEIRSEIVDFFSDNIESKFPGNNYVFDVYRSDKNQLLLIDFNPYGSVTDPLLFTWEELERFTDVEQKPRFRYGCLPEGVQPNEYVQYGIPLDFHDLASGEDPFKLQDFLNPKIQRPGEQASSDDEETLS